MPPRQTQAHQISPNRSPRAFQPAAAIACTDISREAKAQGHTLEFSTRDVAAIATTLFIQAKKEVR